MLVKPLINMFAGEYESGKWRKVLTQKAADKSNYGQVQKVITESVQAFKELNEEALLCKNGDKVIRPAFD